MTMLYSVRMPRMLVYPLAAVALVALTVAGPALAGPSLDNVVLDLTPKQPLPTMSRLILALDAKTWEVRKATIHDQFENTVSMRFTRLAVNSGLPDQLFTFVPPAGVATVPLR